MCLTCLLLYLEKNNPARTLRGLCGHSQKSFRQIGFYSVVDLLEGDHTLGSKK